MKFIADFHIHSRFSMATSSQLVPEMLDLWGKKKGVSVVGTGDAVHPGWLRELKEKLVPSSEGLYVLNEQYRQPDSSALHNGVTVNFVLTTEISCIYKKGDRVRKVHNLIVAPSFDAIEKIARELAKRGNIASDGRPVLGLDSRDLLEIVLTADPRAFIIPAHIWTPWFSVLGSKSGFDSIEECYGDLAGHIFAIETGLSSDPPMNRQCSFLDKYTLVSNSDAHSPENVGREANLFDTAMSYDAMVTALKAKGNGFIGTIEYFPEAGKYHLDGHRKCGICWEPSMSNKFKEICPVCGKRVTVGVLNRINSLADQLTGRDLPDKKLFYSLTSLKNLLSELYNVGPASKKVAAIYDSFIKRAGSEFTILLDMSIEELKVLDRGLGLGVERLRQKNVSVTSGYDGVFGSIKVF